MINFFPDRNIEKRNHQIYKVMTKEEDPFATLFWNHLCRKRNNIARDYPIDRINKPGDFEQGYLDIKAVDLGEAQKKLQEFEQKGLIQIIGRSYRLTDKGEQFCASRSDRKFK